MHHLQKKISRGDIIFQLTSLFQKYNTLINILQKNQKMEVYAKYVTL